MNWGIHCILQICCLVIFFSFMVFLLYFAVRHIVATKAILGQDIYAHELNCLFFGHNVDSTFMLGFHQQKSHTVALE